MIAFLDVDYRDPQAVAACVLAESWDQETASQEQIAEIDSVAEYEPGQFYRRELPCLLAVLQKLTTPPDCVAIDGYVWLDDQQLPGLGAKLFAALEGKIPAVGIAKTRFKTATLAREWFRADSQRPLYVTAIGIDLDSIFPHIQTMHGPYRIPRLIKRVDQLCRTHVMTKREES